MTIYAYELCPFISALSYLSRQIPNAIWLHRKYIVLRSEHRIEPKYTCLKEIVLYYALLVPAGFQFLEN